MEGPGEVTRLLGDLADGDRTALDKLLPIVYADLRALAASCFRSERGDHTLQPTALVHEAYLRLVPSKFSGFENRRQFFAMASTLMRRILVDHARERAADKRSGHRTVLTDCVAPAQAMSIDSLVLGDALERLENSDPDLCRVFDLRYFGGFSVEEVAAVLQVSEPTVKRRWSAARAWLGRELRGGMAARM
jgi:RNA polymerase sigma factor (TIGR02999 family)